MKRELIQATFCYFTAIKCEFFARYEVNPVLALCFTTEKVDQDLGQPEALSSVDMWLNTPMGVGCAGCAAVHKPLWDLPHPWLHLRNSPEMKLHLEIH